MQGYGWMDFTDREPRVIGRSPDLPVCIHRDARDYGKLVVLGCNLYPEPFLTCLRLCNEGKCPVTLEWEFAAENEGKQA